MTINFGFSVKNYKCFKARGASFYTIKYINLLVGKNNVGKSTFLEILDALCNPAGLKNTPFSEVELHEMIDDEVLGDAELDEPHFVLFDDDFDDSSTEPVPAPAPAPAPNDHEHLRGAIATYLESATQIRYVGINCNVSESEESGLRERYSNNMFRNKIDGGYIETDQILFKTHVRLRADRDIVPEYGEENPEFTSNGVGATQIVHALSHFSGHDRDIITKKLLVALNSIFGPDTHFVEITTKYHKGKDVWEIYLSEQDAKLYPLSQSGSGLKTIILVLLNLLVRPEFEKLPVSNYIFSFEELENNLHPSLQRKLFQYLEDFAKKNECHMFITTHSNIAIDAFSQSPDAQINHIQKEGDEVVGALINSNLHSYGVLEDLGHKASDLLQANGLIWVEGPSDRIYIKKFIEIWGDGELKEGVHFQFALFGGSLLAHMDMSMPQHEVSDALSVLRINRNAVLVCDGDCLFEGAPLKKRVVRAKAALEASGGYAWVTECKEIENLIPKEAFQSVNSLEGIDDILPHEKINDYLTRHDATRAANYTDKVVKSGLYASFFTRENLTFRPEIDEHMTKICARIRQWNFM